MSGFHSRVAAALGILLCYAVMVMWVSGRWALAVFQCGLFLLGIAWFRRLMTGVEAWNGRRATIVIALVIAAWAPLQVLTGASVHPRATWDAAVNLLSFVCLFGLAVHVFRPESLRDRFLSWMVWFGFAVSVVGTLQNFTSGGAIFWLFPSGYRDAVIGPFVYRNQYAAFVELLLPIALWKFLTSRQHAFMYAAAAGAMITSVISSGSRAGSILVLAEVVAVFLVAKWRHLVPSRRLTHAMRTMAVLVAVFTLMLGWDTLASRSRSLGLFDVRRELVLSTIDMIRDRPWAGFGLGTWSSVYPAYALYDDGQFVNQAHNDWLQWAAEGGIPFAALMAAFILSLWPRAIRSAWGLGIVFVSIHALVDYPMQQRPAIAAWFFALAGAVAASRSHTVPEVSVPASRGGNGSHERGLIVVPLESEPEPAWSEAGNSAPPSRPVPKLLPG